VVCAALLGGCGGSDAPSSDSAVETSWWKPSAGTAGQWQITGKGGTAFDGAVYDVDLFGAGPRARSDAVGGFGAVDVPKGENAGVIDALHAAGRVVVCYVDTGAFESYRPDAALFPHSVIGNQTYASTGAPWQGERWLDIRAAAWPRFLPLIAARLDL